MKKGKVMRVHICDERWLLGNPIIETDIYGKGGYKTIINELSDANYDVITISEYNKKIVTYANKKDIVVEDELEYLPEYFEKRFYKRFNDFGPMDLGIIFSQDDARLAEKIVLKIVRFCKYLTLPNYPRCRRIAEKVLKINGIQINIENTLEKIEKKCDIILNVKNLELKGRSL